MVKYARVVHKLMLLLHTVLFALLMVGWRQSCRHWRFCVTSSNLVHHTSAAMTSFNLRVVCILSRRACLTAIRIKERLVVGSQSSIILLWKCVEHRERTHASGESIAWTYICFHTFHLVPLFSCSPPPLHHSALSESLTSLPFFSASLPPFQCGFSILYQSPLSTLYLSILPPHLPAISEVSFIFCCLLSFSTMCHTLH